MSTSRPLVSILLPVRDAVETLDEAVGSIREQTLADWELVAVDDGSVDGSGGKLAAHAAEDSRVRVTRSDPRGIVAALETARARARGGILARMDADDRADPERLRLQVEYLTDHPEVALCGTHVRYFPRALVREGARRYEAWLNSLEEPADLVRDLFVECPLAHPTFAMRAGAVERAGGYREGPWPEDYELVLRLWGEGERLGVVPRVLLHWRDGPDRLSRTDSRYSAEAFRALKLDVLALTLLVDREGLVVWGAGPVGKAFARQAIEMGLSVRAFIDLDPRKVGQTIYGVPVILPDGAPQYRTALHLASVAQPGARHEIRSEMEQLGWSEGKDFIAVA